MAKNLNEEYRVSMKFDADTKAAQQQIESLFKTLNKISTSAPKTFDITEFQKAAEAAENLKKHLNAAVNTNTGKLDLSKFSQSLSKSNQSLNDIYKSLHSIGPEGQKAFLQLAASITNADNSTFTLNKKIKELGVTLKNTVKWQISSSMIHGFMGAIQSAYGYAQNLNKSLNNIRIVTGQNIDQMERFAATANKAAKALSTSTLNYTDAALIYYQQGLSDKEVKARTDVTVKMANVTGDTAEKVSQQLTAVWNNFAKGSQNLEYFADVMTALGAATASSTDEISEGLEKFSAIAQTVGLSYEYATAALATVTATTRESASVVGNAFKTLFARLEGLKLGETLDDGTDLNKYSQALATIGVNIKDASGQLRAMDDILDDMAKRWGTLDKATQMATAQTVGGVRQYNTLIALMENWDFMQENLNTARNATGELQKQADIYAQSWEAAQKRVRASLEDIYTTIIDDKAFIGLTDTLAGVVNVIGNVIEGLGGVKGLLLLIGSIVMNTYAKELPTILSNIASNINVLTGAAERNKQNTLLSLSQIIQNNSLGNASNASKAEIESLKTVTQMTIELNEKRKQLSQTEIAAYESKIKMIQAYGRSTVAIGKEIDALQQETKELTRSITSSLIKSENWDINTGHIKSEITKTQTSKADLSNSLTTNKGWLTRRNKDLTELKQKLIKLQGGSNIDDATKTEIKNTKQQIKEVSQSIKEKQKEIWDQEKNIANLDAKLIDLNKKIVSGRSLLQQIQQETKAYGQMTVQIGKAKELAESLGTSVTESDVLEYLNKLKSLNIDVSEFFNADGSLQDIETVKELLINIEDMSTKSGTSLQDQYNKIERLGASLVALGADETAVQQLIKDLKTTEMTAEELEERIKSLGVAQSQSIQHTMAFSEALGQMAGLVTQTAMAINALKNLGNIWNNEDITTGEKILQTMTSLSTIMPIVITFTNGQKVAELGAAAARLLGISTIGGMTAAEYAQAAANEAVAITGYAALGPLLLFIGIIGVVVGGIIAITKAIETDAEKLERLKKEQEELNEITEKATQEWEEFKNTLSDYNSAVTGLEKLKEGASEFNEELEQANSLAKELITKLSLNFLEDYFYNDKGLIQFTKSGQDKIDYANQQIAAGQQALAWAGYEKDRQVQAQNQVVDNDKRKKEKYDYVKSRFGVSYGTNVNWTSFEDEVLRQFADENGQVNLDNISQQEVADYARQQFLGNLNADKALTFADYVIESLKEQNRTTAFNSNNYNQEKQNITEYLGSNDPYSGLIANALFGSQADVDNIVSQAKDKIANSDIDQLWKDTYGMLSNESQKTLLEDFNGDKSQALLGGVSANIAQINATALSNSLKLQTNKFSTGNQEVLNALLTGTTQQLSPEQLLKELSLTESEIEAFQEAYKLLYHEQANIYDLYKQAQGNYSIVDWHKSQIQGIQSIQESIKELNKAFGSLKFGDTVEDISSLSEASQTYFTKMEDGTWKLIGSAEQFQDSLFRDNANKFESNIANFNNIADSRKGIVTRGLLSSGLTIDEQQQYKEIIISYALLSDNLDQLNYIKEKFNELNIEEKYQAEATQIALQDLATKYDTCTEELTLFQQALLSEDAGLITTTRSILEFSIASAEAAETANLDAEELESQARRISEKIKEDYKEIKNVTKASTDWAVANQRLDRGINSLAKSLQTNKEIIARSDKTTTEYTKALDETKQAVADVFNISNADLLDDSFILELINSGDLDIIAQGGDQAAKAIERLQKRAAESIVQKIKLRADPDAQDSITNFLKQLQLPELELKVGTHIDGKSDFVAALNDMIKAAGMTKDEITSLLGSMGMSATLHTDYVKQTRKAPVTVTKQKIIKTGEHKEIIPGSGGAEITVPDFETGTVTYTAGYTDVDEMVPVYSIETKSGKYGSGGGIDIIGTPPPTIPIPPNTGKGGSGGGSKSVPKTKSDVVKRYKEITDEINDLSDAYSDASIAADRLFGKNRISMMEEQVKLLQQQNNAYQRRNQLTQEYLKEDYDALLQAAAAAGVDFSGLIMGGNIENYTSELTRLFSKYDADQILAGNDEEARKRLNLDERWEQIQTLQKAIDQYDQTVQENEDDLNKQRDLLNQIQDLNYQMMNYKIELRLDIREKDMQFVENKIKMLGDEFFKRAEVFALMASKMGIYNDSTGTMRIDHGQYRELEQDLNNLTAAMENQTISEADYIDGLENVISHSQAAFDDFMNQNEEMKTYYADTLAAMSEGLSFFANQIDHLNDSLEHYKKLMSLWGREQDYRGMDIILRGQLRNRQSSRETAQQNYEMLKRQYDTVMARYNAETNEEIKKRLFESEVQPITAALQEAESTLWSAQEAFAEAAKAVFENLKEEAYHVAEMSLTAGQGFDALNEKMELASKYQDEYLTRTNQIYETNKLLRNINRDIDSTNNTAAKTKLKNFSNEIQAMQDQNQLNQLDLKIAQARYEILKAQIALEEAKDAKSTVRLQRDSEGNFGYVYTGDREAVGKAEEELANKTNDLYNLVLKNSNDYGQKMVELRKSTLDQLANLDQNADDYEIRRKEILDRSYALYKSYAEQYGTALYWLGETAATDTFEAWTTEFIDPANYSLQNFADSFDTYTTTMTDIYSEFKDNLADDEKVDQALKDITSEIAGADAALLLLTSQASTYIGQSDSLVTKVDNETAAWARQYTEIMALAGAYQKLMENAQTARIKVMGDIGYQSDRDYSIDMAKAWLGEGSMSLENAMAHRDAKISGQGLGGKVKTSEEILALIQSKSEDELRKIINGKAYFASGGYTGEWGPSGKLAFLHQKELVLNADDTKNFLNGIYMLRQITDMIDLHAAAMGTADSWVNAMSLAGNRNLDQNVTIHAEFPNVTQHNEIELAFADLINRASQYVNRY